MLSTIQVPPHEMRLDTWQSPWLKTEVKQFAIKTEMKTFFISRGEKTKTENCYSGACVYKRKHVFSKWSWKMSSLLNIGFKW